MAIAELNEVPHAIVHAHSYEEEEEHARPQMNQVGLWLFFLSETFLFSALFAARSPRARSRSACGSDPGRSAISSSARARCAR